MKKLRKRLALVSCVLLLLSMTCNSVLAAEIPSGEGTPNAETSLDETGDPEPEEKETEEAAPEGTESGQDETKEEGPEESETNGTETDVVEPGDSESDDAGPEETGSVEKETEVTDSTESDSEETEPEAKLPEESQPAEPEDEEKDPAETEAVETPETLPEENQTEETLPEESEAAEETKEKVNLLSVSQKMTMPISSEGSVTLMVGEEVYDTVNLTEDGSLGDFPEDPKYTGWKFEGWYTDVVEGVYLAGGDPKLGEHFDPQVSISKDETVKNIKDELDGTRMLEDLEEKYSGDEAGLKAKLLSMHHTWAIYTRGKEVKAGDKPGDVDILYAKFAPMAANITWDSDGWNASSGALHSGRSYGSYVYPWTLNPSTWGDRIFEGWSFTKGGKAEIDPNTVYQVGEEPLEWDKFESGKVRLYAVWKGGPPRVVSEITVRRDTSSDRLRHYNYGWKVRLYYEIKPEGAIYDSVEWSSDQPSHVSIDPQSNNSAMVTVYDGVPSETVTVTVSAGGKTGEITIPVKHDWVLKYKQDPTCQHTGYAVYKCSGCPDTWQPTLPQTEHKFKSSFSAATCTEDGYRLDECTYCGFTKETKTDDAKGHDFETTTVTGCGGEVTTRTCRVCGYTESDVDVNAADHQWESSPRIDKAPTCSESGSRSTHCSLCGLTKDSEVIPADPSLHKWKGWMPDKKATYEERGLESRECHICGAKETREIEVLILGESNPPSNIPGSGSGSSGSSSSSSSSSSSGGSSSGGGSSDSGSSQSTTSHNSTVPGPGNESVYVPSVVPGTGSQVTTVVNTVADSNATAGVTNAQVVSGAWSQNEQGDWSLSYGDGAVASNTWVCVTEADGAHWYHFSDTGVMDSGWLNLDGKVYFLHDVHDGTAGRMLTGWQFIGEKWYYFSKEEDETLGLLLTNTTTPDGYKVNDKGEWIQ